MFSSNSSDPAERAKALLVHYLDLAGNGRGPSGVSGGDGYAEISDLVDAIVEAAADSLEARAKRPVNDVRYIMTGIPSAS
jgi:hypothetical protein